MTFARFALAAILAFGLAPLPVFPVSTAFAQSQGADMKQAFEVLSVEHRKKVQQAMKWEGFYAGKVDGAWGPGTEAAIPKLAAWLEDIAKGELHPPKFPLQTRQDVTKLFGYVISGQADIYLVGQ